MQTIFHFWWKCTFNIADKEAKIGLCSWKIAQSKGATVLLPICCRFRENWSELLDVWWLKKCFSRVLTLQGLLSTLIYSWYTNTEQQKEKQDKLNCSYKNIWPFMCRIYIKVVLKKECTNVSQKLHLYTNRSMNEKYVKGVEKRK